MTNLSETIKDRVGIIGVSVPINTHIERIMLENPDIKVVVIGEGNVNDIIHQLPKDKKIVLISSPILNKNIIEINGIKYVEKHKQTNKLLPLIQSYESYNKPKERPNVDIVTEYELVINHKSSLSKSNRDWVIKQFEDKYEKYEETNK